jgi:hypothetical protein
MKTEDKNHTMELVELPQLVVEVVPDAAARFQLVEVLDACVEPAGPESHLSKIAWRKKEEMKLCALASHRGWEHNMASLQSSPVM